MSKDRFENLTDEELIERLHAGEVSVIDFLMEKHKDLVRMHAKALYLPGADSEDLIQEGMIGLFKAIRDYDDSHDASFKTFARLCISRQMMTAVENSRRKKHAPLNSYVSLYAADDDGDETIMESLSSLAESSPEDKIIDRERVQTLTNEILKVLSPLETKVFRLYLTGMNYAEIARVLECEEKSMDNALQRIKRKIRKSVLVTE
ncbi:MAG: RNA polymerase sporulation sigma factor SigH [Lachnospiraceae bacterium]|nr:RNA polymerase sporulation sigma factor SigH [Lachnospiraceae bacterium]